MKKLFVVCGALCLLLGVLDVGAQQPATDPAAPTVESRKAPFLEVKFAAICEGVVDREPVGVSTSFSPEIETLFCCTRVEGADVPTQITHVWYYGATERARVTLAIGSSNWRTYSSKRIQPHEIGRWHVDVVDTEGNVLVSLPFEIVATSAPARQQTTSQ